MVYFGLFEWTNEQANNKYEEYEWIINLGRMGNHVIETFFGTISFRE